jgi:type I restriction enzyme, R subunit
MTWIRNLKTLEEAHDPLDDIVRRFNERWFQKIFEDVMLKKRRNELELYKLLAGDCEP